MTDMKTAMLSFKAVKRRKGAVLLLLSFLILSLILSACRETESGAKEEAVSGVVVEQSNVDPAELQSQLTPDEESFATNPVKNDEDTGISDEETARLKSFITYIALAPFPDFEEEIPVDVKLCFLAGYAYKNKYLEVSDFPGEYTFKTLDSVSKKIFGQEVSSQITGEIPLPGVWEKREVGNGLRLVKSEYEKGTVNITGYTALQDEQFEVMADVYSPAMSYNSLCRMKILIRRDNTYEFGFQPISAKTEVVAKKVIERTESSSQRPTVTRGENEISFAADNLLDGNRNTAWAEAAAGNGVREWVQLYPAADTVFSAIGIVNGYAANTEIFQDNNRVKRISVQLPGGELREYILPDTRDPHFILLNAGTKAKWIKITILEVYSGNKTDTTYLSNIMLY